jgi:membrane-bound lytic murein transglycosylase A
MPGAAPRPGLTHGAALAGAFLFGAALAWALKPCDACSQTPAAPPGGPPAAIDGADLAPVAFADLPGWSGDDQAGALKAFKISCSGIALSADRFTDRRLGSPEGWQAACVRASRTTARNARTFFEENFDALEVSPSSAPASKITGYYEPELDGRMSWSVITPEPAYAQPADLVTADPAAFSAILKGERLSGKVSDGLLVPFDTRAQIRAAQGSGRFQPLVWLRSRADHFFLQIQGSGRVRLMEGGQMRLGYAAQNGHPYTAIGAILIARGEIERENMSMQSIRAWLAANPDEADALMDQNASFVFFRASPLDDPTTGPEGAEGVPLTPGRSLAIDARVYPYGVPIFVSGQIGSANGGADETMNRLMVAQDTGGAIRGIVRGDVFFGWGAEAEIRAGATDGAARFFILVPKQT